MNTPTLHTRRLILRKFNPDDIQALFLILKDEEANRFLPWYPVKTVEEAKKFYQERYAAKYNLPQAYAYAVCLKSDNVPMGYILPYITATHDINNPRSGNVMEACGMKYQYTYEEQWQPKNFPVFFRMYQLNFSTGKDFVYKKYWDMYPNHFIEKL